MLFVYTRYTVNYVIAMLEDDNFVEANVYLTPPGNGLESDKDSDSEEGSLAVANHLSSHQLTALVVEQCHWNHFIIICRHLHPVSNCVCYVLSTAFHC